MLENWEKLVVTLQIDQNVERQNLHVCNKLDI